MKLKKIVRFAGEIHCLTGLCVGGTNNDINIGGLDKEVIKNPITNEPYIPGSSLKGKMRSQLEKKRGVGGKEPCGCGKKQCDVCLLFGAHKNPNSEASPTRIIVRDARLSEETRAVYQSLPAEKGNFLEFKGENIINRKKGTAESPRFFERVPEGAVFDMEILLQVFEEDSEERMIKAVKEALGLVELSYLGGSGSRGYGKVKFEYTVEEINVQGDGE
jgi:CRISPR-associated protein Csm3